MAAGGLEKNVSIAKATKVRKCVMNLKLPIV